MGLDDAVIESDDQQVDSSSEDLRSALESAVAEVSERARDEQGRFAREEARKAAQDSPPATSEAPAKDQAPTQQQQPLEGQEAPQAIKPPDAWSPAAKAKFATLDPEIQAEVMRREQEVHKGFTRQDEHRNLGKAFSDAITPYIPMIRAEGATPVAAVGELLQTAYVLRNAGQEQKQQMFLNLAQQYGVDVNGIFQRLAGGQQPTVDPQVASLQQQVAQLQQVIQGSQQAVQAQEATQIHQTIEGFASDPKNVYFANVKAEMAALLREGHAQDLQGAYDMACWARPDIRQLLLQQQEQQRAAELRAKANKARTAGSSVSGSPTGAPAGGTATDGSDLRETLRASYREAMGTL